MLFLNELRKLFGRRQFTLLLAVLFFLQLASLYLYEKNTEDYLYLCENHEAYQNHRETQHETDQIDYYETMLQEESAYPEEYRIFIEEMEIRTEQLKKSSLLTDDDPFRNADLDKTLKDYEALKGTKIIPGDHTAVRKYGTYMTGVLFEIAFVLLLLYYGFSEDKEQGRYQLLRSTKKGRNSFAISKIGTLFVVAILYTFLQELSVIILLSGLYGAGDLTAPVQSVPLFRNTCLSIIILGMYGLSLLYKGLSILTVFSLAWYLGTVTSRFSKAVLYISGILTAEFIQWNKISASSAMRALRYVNVFGLYLPEDSIGAYTNLNLFGTPAEKRFVAMILLGMLTAGGITAGVIVFSVNSQARKDRRFSGLWNKIRGIFRLHQETGSLWILELYKPLSQQKKLIFIAVILVYGASLLQNARRPVFFGSGQDAAYEYYAEKLSGEYGERQEAVLEEEELRLKEERNQANILLEEANELKKNKDNEEASLMAYSKEQEAQFILSGLTTYESAWFKVKEQCSALEQRADRTGKTVYFINIPMYKRYFRRIDDRLITFLILAAVTVILTSGLYAMDERFGMKTLIHSTMNGQKNLRRIRFSIMLGFVFLVFLIFLIPEAVRLYRIDQFSCLKAFLGDFLTEDVSDRLRIITVLLLTVLIKLGGFLLFGFSSLVLSQKLKSELATIVVLLSAAILITVFGFLFRTDLITLILKAGGIS